MSGLAKQMRDTKNVKRDACTRSLRRQAELRTQPARR